MDNMEKVIKGLECCMIEPGSCPEECPYRGQGDETEYCDEKIIKDVYTLLKAQKAESVDAPKPDSDIGCWYDITHNYTLEQVVSALKAQEPRVMTWQEVIGAAIECKPLYVEVKDSEDKEPGDDRWAMVTQYKDSITNGMIRAMSSYITSEVFFKDWYGKKWRCWTSRPSDEQRKAVAWE